jgi:geranylgeranyl diphosphate synthase type II
MVGGQAADLEAENWKNKNHGFNPARHLEYIHLHKTASLIVASLEAGGILARAPENRLKALSDYGRALGLAFQIADDVLDAVGDKKKMGKMGSDAANNKLTYVSLYGVEKARMMAQREASKAKAALDVFSSQRNHWLKRIADYTIERDK